MPGPNLNSTGYIVGFATALCGVCAVFVAASAVGLKDLQEANKLVDRQSKVLAVAGLLEKDEELSADQIQSRYQKNIKARLITLASGEYVEDADANAFDQRKATNDPARSQTAPTNAAQVTRIPNKALVYHVLTEGQVKTIILPIVGKGLWSTMYGFLALDADAKTISGITFYEHGETPGLGGEVENPKWQALWPGRKAFNEQGEVAVKVIKGNAGSPQEDPYSVDGLSGATITSRGVSATLAFWLGDTGYGPYLERFRGTGGARSAL
ncbi:MAG: Na(+)-translocating NADH-quinone reductase subunit C [Myxococcota bacterium]